jgi:hypothetical protein
MPAPRTPAPQGASRTVLFVLLLGVLCAVATGLELRLFGTPFSWPFIALLIYFPLVSGLLLLWQERAMVADLRHFIHRFMLGLVVKLLGSLVLLAILIHFSPKSALSPLVVTFTLLYFIWLGFSTGRLGIRLRRPSTPAA